MEQFDRKCYKIAAMIHRIDTIQGHRQGIVRIGCDRLRKSDRNRQKEQGRAIEGAAEDTYHTRIGNPTLIAGKQKLGIPKLLANAFQTLFNARY